jgi:hypothetical protein
MKMKFDIWNLLGTWWMLLEHGHVNAAFGLVCDVFSCLERMAQEVPPADLPPDVVQWVRCTLRKQLMNMLHERADEELSQWLDRWRKHCRLKKEKGLPDDFMNRMLSQIKEEVEEAQSIAALKLLVDPPGWGRPRGVG